MYISKPCILELGLKPDLVYNSSHVASPNFCAIPCSTSFESLQSPFEAPLIPLASTPDIGQVATLLLDASLLYHLLQVVPPRISINSVFARTQDQLHFVPLSSPALFESTSPLFPQALGFGTSPLPNNLCMLHLKF